MEHTKETIIFCPNSLTCVSAESYTYHPKASTLELSRRTLLNLLLREFSCRMLGLGCRHQLALGELLNAQLTMLQALSPGMAARRGQRGNLKPEIVWGLGFTQTV